MDQNLTQVCRELAAIYDGAADDLEQYGHTKHTEYRIPHNLRWEERAVAIKTAPACLTGAVRRSAAKVSTCYMQQGAVNYLVKLGYGPLWNDDENRTVQEVIDMLRLEAKELTIKADAQQ